jgi:hypothetical protein
MKTLKAKTISKPKKTSKGSKTVRSKKVTISKSLPNEEDIRKKAEEIYLQRIAHGEDGTAIDDWHKAEELLRGS